MKKLLIVLLVFSCINVSAQEFTMKPKGRTTELTVEIQNVFSDLVIQGNSTGEIKILTEDYEGTPSRAAGLRPLSAPGPDNSGVGMYIDQKGDTVTIYGAHRNRQNSDYNISLPADIKLRINYGGFRSNDIIIRGMHNDVEIRSQVGDLVFEDVTGPIIASTVSSDIQLVFSSLNQLSPTSITSVSGDVDITLPEDSKADFYMSSVSGEIYTNLDFEVTRSKKQQWYGGGMAASSRLNGGGVEFTVKTVSGDIYIRKAD